MSVINIFKTEKELFKMYPKTTYWSLKNIFRDYWNYFLSYAETENLIIRDIVHRDVDRMIKCQSMSLGFSLYKCPTCSEEKIVPHM